MAMGFDRDWISNPLQGTMSVPRPVGLPRILTVAPIIWRPVREQMPTPKPKPLSLTCSVVGSYLQLKEMPMRASLHEKQ